MNKDKFSIEYESIEDYIKARTVVEEGTVSADILSEAISALASLKASVSAIEDKLQKVLNMFMPQPDVPEYYVLATDEDFSGTTNGDFRYIGTDEYVIIPHIIKGVPVTSYAYMFENTSVKGVVSDNPNVTDMSYMFAGSAATSLDLSSFDTSSVTYMGYMFDGCAATSLDLSSFDTSSVMYMDYMFRNSAATSLDLSSFNTSSVTDMSYMFAGSAATSLDLSSFNTSSVMYMGYMFDGCAATSLDLSSFDTSSVTYMDYMFRNSAATVLDLSSFNTSSVVDMSYMFDGCAATIGYARTQADADRFNASVGKPSSLTFTVKGA